MKHRLKELLKTAGAIALTLTLASAAFIGVNSAAFAAVTQPKQLLPVALSANTIEKTKNTFLKTDYQKPVLTVFEILSTFDKNTEALSPEEAAVIGARYIWDVYGESIDGKIVAMQYNGDTGRTRPYWIGTVGDSRTALEAVIQYSNPSEFYFIIDALTGARVEISQNENRLGAKAKTLSADWDDIKKELPAGLDEYTQIAQAYAQKHFNTTEVASVTFDHTDIVRGTDGRVMINGDRPLTPEQQEELEAFSTQAREEKSREMAKDQIAHVENAESPLTYLEKSLHFNAADDTGREARIIITMESKQLLSLTTFHNDLFPGISEGY